MANFSDKIIDQFQDTGLLELVSKGDNDISTHVKLNLGYISSEFSIACRDLNRLETLEHLFNRTESILEINFEDGTPTIKYPVSTTIGGSPYDIAMDGGLKEQQGIIKISSSIVKEALLHADYSNI